MAQREIKFRAWATGGRRMVDLKEITPLALDKGMLDEGDGLFLPFRDNIILMQYTGLKDRNGKEIYEGDIVEVVPYFLGSEPEKRRQGVYVAPILWSNKAGAWVYGKREGWNAALYDATTVIGNIYENPELLK